MNETHTRYAKMIKLKTMQVIGEKCAKLLVLVEKHSTLIVFEIYSTQKSGFFFFQKCRKHCLFEYTPWSLRLIDCFQKMTSCTIEQCAMCISSYFFIDILPHLIFETSAVKKRQGRAKSPWAPPLEISIWLLFIR